MQATQAVLFSFVTVFPEQATQAVLFSFVTVFPEQATHAVWSAFGTVFPVQCVQEFCPVVAEIVLSKQGLHSVLPVWSWYVPSVHNSQLV